MDLLKHMLTGEPGTLWTEKNFVQLLLWVLFPMNETKMKKKTGQEEERRD